MLLVSKKKIGVKAQKYGQHFSCNLSPNNAALQVEMICCAYYHLLAQQMFMLQNVNVTSTCATQKFVAQEGGVSTVCSLLQMKSKKKTRTSSLVISQWSQEKLGAMLMKIFGGTNEEY